MTRSILLDTHAWIWLVNGDANLSKKAINYIQSFVAENNIFLSTISTWELAMLEAKKKIILTSPCLEWINKSLQLTGIQLLPLSPNIAVESSRLPGDFHGDPADRIIVATARIENLTLVTKDSKIIEYSKQKYLVTYSL